MKLPSRKISDCYNPTCVSQSGFGYIIKSKQARSVFLNPNLTQLLYESPAGCSSGEVEDEIRRNFGRIQRAEIPYNPVSSNSNSAAFQVLEDVLGYRPQPRVQGRFISAPGWEVNPYTKQVSRKAHPYKPIHVDEFGKVTYSYW